MPSIWLSSKIIYIRRISKNSKNWYTIWINLRNINKIRGWLGKILKIQEDGLEENIKLKYRKPQERGRWGRCWVPIPERPTKEIINRLPRGAGRLQKANRIIYIFYINVLDIIEKKLKIEEIAPRLFNIIKIGSSGIVGGFNIQYEYNTLFVFGIEDGKHY